MNSPECASALRRSTCLAILADQPVRIAVYISSVIMTPLDNR